MNKPAIRIIYMTDTQIRGTNPKGRVDDFPAALKAKFREVFQMAQELDEDDNCVIVHGGDLFDSPDLSYSIAGEFAQLLMECPVRFYVVPGNHDEYAHNLETINRTVLGLMARVGLVKLLGDEPSTVQTPDRSVVVQITGKGFHPNMDSQPGDYMVPELANDPDYKVDKAYRVHVVHGMLVKDGFPGPHTTIANCQTNADVLLSGHEHNGYGLMVKDQDGLIHNPVTTLNEQNGSTIFCNPGATARVDASAEDMLRPVRVAVFEFTEDGIDARLVPLKCAKPGCEVLSREHIVKATEREERMNKFLGLLSQEGEMKFLSVQEIVQNIAQRKALPTEIVDDVMVRIGRAREELGRKRVG